MTRAPNRTATRAKPGPPLEDIVLVWKPLEFRHLRFNVAGPSGDLGGYAKMENILIQLTDLDTLHCPLTGVLHERLRRYLSNKYGKGGPNGRIRTACTPALARLSMPTEEVPMSLPAMPTSTPPTEQPARALITPEMARAYLQHNTINRRIRKAWVSYLARQMRAGLWELTSDGIAFYADGGLANGQHRLMAVIEAGMPVWFIVVRNVSRGSYLVTDRGVGRTMSDVLNLHTALVADANLLVYLTTGQTGGRHTEAEVRDVAAWWQPAHDALAVAANHQNVQGFSSAGFRIGCGVRWAIGRSASERQYVLDQYVAIQRNDTSAMSTAGATLWKRWLREKYGGGRLTHRLAGAVVSFHHLDPRRAGVVTQIKYPDGAMEALREAAGLLEHAYAATLPTAKHPYETLYPRGTPSLLAVRPGAPQEEDRPSA